MTTAAVAMTDELTELDAHVERHEHADEVGVRVGQFRHRAGEAEPVEQAECEHNDDAPRPQARGEEILDADVRDRQRDERFDDVSRRALTMPYRLRPSVTVCAIVKALTCQMSCRTHHSSACFARASPSTCSGQAR